MGSINDHFSDLSDYLLASRSAKASPAERRLADAQSFLRHFLKPWLPPTLRVTPGAVFDSKDRFVGPFDVVGADPFCPPVGEGAALRYPADGALFTLHVRDWAHDDMSAFGALSHDLKKLERKTSNPIFCAAVTFNALSLSELTDFLGAREGSSIDAVLSVGHHLVVRNLDDLYGSSKRVPMVSERGAGPSLKAFAFLLLKLAASFAGSPFLLADYQHL